MHKLPKNTFSLVLFAINKSIFRFKVVLEAAIIKQLGGGIGNNLFSAYPSLLN